MCLQNAEELDYRYKLMIESQHEIIRYNQERSAIEHEMKYGVETSAPLNTYLLVSGRQLSLQLLRHGRSLILHTALEGQH